VEKNNIYLYKKNDKNFIKIIIVIIVIIMIEINKYKFSIKGSITNALYLDYWNPYEYSEASTLANKKEIKKIRREYKENILIIYANNIKILKNIRRRCKNKLKDDNYIISGIIKLY